MEMENFVLNGNGEIEINRKNINASYTFHLQEINHNTELCSNKDLGDDTATTLSSYSNYKHRIDAMFDDSKSILSDLSKSDRKRKSATNKQETNNKERVIANNIQEKIEKMFEEISVNGFQKHTSSTNLSLRKDQQSSARDYFTVTYLGSKPLTDKNISLMSLQDPLKDLYFEYKKNPSEDQMNVITITKEGLKIRVSEKEELNPFPTIAVWASVKLSFRKTSNTLEYAFLPLVTDPEGVDKNLLFRKLKLEDKENFIQTDYVNESPIFAIVMKNLSKQLECHAFICQSSEEAIVIAANLYQALMKKMKRKKDHREPKLKKSPDKLENSESEKNRTKPTVKVKKPAPLVPVISTRSEEKNAESTSKDVMNGQTLNATEVQKKQEEGNLSQRRGSVPNVSCEPPRTLRRTVSERGGSSMVVKNQTDRGDILTKVAIPRSGSFLNAKGPLTRFSGRNKTNQKNESVSPLGFKELFNELRFHEGLESMDDILNAIIDAEGMSFNDLKPIYKEFLLKLAVTLTKDELYQRSKMIMRRQKKRNKSTRFKKKAFLSTMGLGKIFRKTASRLGGAKSPRPTNLEFTSIVFQSTTKQFDSNLPNVRNRKVESRVKRRQSSRRRLSKRLEKVNSKHVSTTSEDSDFFQPKRNTNDSGGGPNRSSSGYFSCSECSCDSEKCTCLRTDKCYCTLGHKKGYVVSSSDESRLLCNKKQSFRLNKELTLTYDLAASLKSCSCDTDSCVDSTKCYCTQKKNKTSHNYKMHFLSGTRGICQTPHLHEKEDITSKRSCNKHKDNKIPDQECLASESTISVAESSPINRNTNDGRHKNRLRTSRSLKRLPDQPLQFICPYPLTEERQHLKQNFLQDVQCTCIHETQKSVRPPSFPSSRRQYSSMRCRSEFDGDFTQPLQRSVSYRTKNFFSSVRSKQSCNSIMNHIKFPNREKSSLRFTRRMDVYNSFSENRHLTQEDDFAFCRDNRGKPILEYRFPSSDARVFHVLRTNSEQRNCLTSEDSESKVNRKKVLVVSARDPKGKVLYMGARCENSKNHPSKANASEALAVKKSAEIAALFSDVTSKHKKTHLDYAKDQRQCNYAARSNSYRSTNLENTLGYLP